MRHRLTAILASASLLLFLITCVLWAVSYRFPPNRAGGDVLAEAQQGDHARHEDSRAADAQQSGEDARGNPKNAAS